MRRRRFTGPDRVNTDATPVTQKRTGALLWSYGGAIGRAGAQVGIQLVLARLLGPEAYGQAMAVFVVQTVGWLLAEGGFGAALVQKQTLVLEDIQYVFGWVLTVSLIAGLGVAIAARPIAVLLGDVDLKALLQVSGLLIPVQALSNIPVSLLRRDLDMRWQQLVQLVSYLISYGAVGIALAWSGAGAWSLVAAFGLFSLLVLIGSHAGLQNYPLSIWRPRWRGDAALRRYGLQVTGTNLVNWGIENLDRLLISRYWGIAALGEYAAAANLSRAPANLLVSSAQSVTFSSASRQQQDIPVLRSGYLTTLQLCALVVWPTFTWLAVHAHTVVHLLYDDRWAGAAPLFTAFCTALPLYALLAVTGPVLWAVGAVHTELRAQLICLAVLLCALMSCIGRPLVQVVWLLVPIYGLRLALIYIPLAKRLQLAPRNAARALLPGVLLALIALGTGTVTEHGLHGSPWAAGAAALVVVVAASSLVAMAPRWWLGDAVQAALHRRWGNPRTKPQRIHTERR